MYGVIAYIVTYILDGQPVWNLVFGMAIAGFSVLWVYFAVYGEETIREKQRSKKANGRELE